MYALMYLLYLSQCRHEFRSLLGTHSAQSPADIACCESRRCCISMIFLLSRRSLSCDDRISRCGGSDSKAGEKRCIEKEGRLGWDGTRSFIHLHSMIGDQRCRHPNNDDDTIRDILNTLAYGVESLVVISS